MEVLNDLRGDHLWRRQVPRRVGPNARHHHGTPLRVDTRTWADPPELVVRHRCDEPLCTAEADLALGTYADNRWDAIARPHRAADLDVRGSAGRSRAIREAVLRVLDSVGANSATIGAAARAAMLAGDPNRHQLTLWATPSNPPPK